MAAAPRKKQPLLFVDSNIWLDFYRARNDTALELLDKVAVVSDRLVINYQVEMEFKKNRLAAIQDGVKELKSPNKISRLGVFSDVDDTHALSKSIEEAEKCVKSLKNRLRNILKNPEEHDPVYKSCHKMFRHVGPLNLTKTNDARFQIRRLAFRRFLQGFPPRKTSDTSIGDAFNWEWMVHCASAQNADLVIVSRDGDYGSIIEKELYLNDQLREEFEDRVGKHRRVDLLDKLSDALKHMKVSVSKRVVDAEEEIIEAASAPVLDAERFLRLKNFIDNARRNSTNNIYKLNAGDRRKYVARDFLGPGFPPEMYE